jgi:hypothetical protein
MRELSHFLEKLRFIGISVRLSQVLLCACMLACVRTFYVLVLPDLSISLLHFTSQLEQTV